MSTLYEIGEDLSALEELLTEIGGEVTEEEMENTIDQWILENSTNLKGKLNGYGKLIRSLEDRAGIRASMAKIKAEEPKRLKDLADVDFNAVKRLKRRLCAFFEAKGIQRVETELFRFTKALNGGTRSVLVEQYYENHPNELPEPYRDVLFTPNKNNLREALEGDDAEDVSQYATLAERGSHIRIK